MRKKADNMKKGFLTPRSAIVGIGATVIYFAFLRDYVAALIGATPASVFGQLVFVAIAIVLIIMSKAEIKDSLPLRIPKCSEIISCTVLYFGARLLVSAYVAFTGFFGIMNTRNESISSTVEAMGPVVAMIVIAVLPAICEEIFFRGFLLSCFKGEKNVVIGIIISSLVFGLMHFDIYTLLPAMLMGAVFAVVTKKTETLLLSVLFHYDNNCTSIRQLFFGGDGTEQIADILPKELLYLSLRYLAVGAVCVVLPYIWLNKIEKKRLALSMTTK